MSKSDFKAASVIGAAVGALSQIIIENLVASPPSLVLRLAVLAGFSLLAPAALFAASLIGRVVPVIYQFAKFAAVGTLNTFIDIGVLNLEIFLSGHAAGVYYTVFKAISFAAATTNSFIWNKYWTFGAKETKASSEAPRFYVFATVGWALNVGAATFVVNGLARPAAVSPNLWANIGALAGVAAAFLWDFFSYKYFVFKKPSAVGPSAAVR